MKFSKAKSRIGLAANRSKGMRALAMAVAVAGTLAPAVSHAAFVVDSTTAVGTIFAVDYELTNLATDPNGNLNNLGIDLTASAVFTLLEFDATNSVISLGVEVTNTTDVSDNNAGIQKLAFGTDPDATGVVFTDDDDAGFISASTAVSPEVQNAVAIDLDVQSLTGTGAPRILREGQVDYFQLDVSFSSLTDDGVTFEPFSSKWQTASASFEFPGEYTPPEIPDIPDIPSTPQETVAAPIPLALISFGGVLLGLSRRWRSR